MWRVWWLCFGDLCVVLVVFSGLEFYCLLVIVVLLLGLVNSVAFVVFTIVWLLCLW